MAFPDNIERLRKQFWGKGQLDENGVPYGVRQVDSRPEIHGVGEVQENPTEFTILRRLKDLLTGISLSVGNAIIGKVKIVDDLGNVIGSLEDGLNVHQVDAHRIGLNLHFINPTGISETFGVLGASAGDSVFDVASGQGGTYSVNDHIRISEVSTGKFEINTVKILVVSTDTITVDRPLENSYTSAGVVEIVETDLSTANGTVASPVVFEIAPPATKISHINTFVFHFEDGPNPSIELFSGIAALTNGVVLRSETIENGNNNHVVLRTNGDKREYFGGNEVLKVQRVGGGDYAIDSIWHYKEHTGAIIRLDGSQGDKTLLIIQNDLTDITLGEGIGQGHYEG